MYGLCRENRKKAREKKAQQQTDLAAVSCVSIADDKTASKYRPAGGQVLLCVIPARPQGTRGCTGGMAKYRPPLWSSKLYGEPHGMWEPEPGAVEIVPGPISNSKVAQIEEALRNVVTVRARVCI